MFQGSPDRSSSGWGMEACLSSAGRWGGLPARRSGASGGACQEALAIPKEQEPAEVLQLVGPFPRSQLLKQAASLLSACLSG